MTAIPKPTRAERLAESAERKTHRRSSAVRNPSGAALPKPEVWHDAKYRAWAVKRYDCGIKGHPDHICGRRVAGRILKQFAHAEPEGRGLKSSDYYGVVLCELAHLIQTTTSWERFQQRFGFDRDATARRIFESSPWLGKVEVGGCMGVTRKDGVT